MVMNLRKYGNLISIIVQTLVCVALAFVLTIISCGFSLKDFNWVRFVMSFVFTTYTKASFTSYAKTVAMRDTTVVSLRLTIDKDRKAFFKAKKTKECKEEITRRNKINKLDAYIGILDSKRKITPRITKLRDWAYNYRDLLIKHQDTSACEKEKSLNSIRVKYTKINFGKLFTYGLSKADDNTDALYFSAFKSTMRRMTIPTLASALFSVLSGAISNDSTILSGEVWIDLFMYLFSITMGAWWGLNNGKAIVQEDYVEVLTNVAGLIREIKTEIGVVDDDTISPPTEEVNHE